MKTLDYSVAVHSCLLQFDVKVKHYLVTGEKYLSAPNDYFRLLPSTCRCKKSVTLFEAKRLVEMGTAEPIYCYRRNRLQLDDYSIWMAQARQVPRVDLISKADIERAYASGDPDVAAAAMEYIEEVHAMYMENRAKLIVPFRPQDPFDEGQLLFPFGAEERTSGGYTEARDR